LGTDIKNLHMEKLCLAAVYQHAKFCDDMTTFMNIKADIFKATMETVEELHISVFNHEQN